MRSRDLSPLQLEIVMHLANGKRIGEIATLVSRSQSYVSQEAKRARLKVNASTLPQLVSIVLVSDKLEWTGHEYRVNGA